ncbi:MAG: amino acid ABC transporter ATP-binding protein [Coriobacteriales bacterium]|nr:amino acid ABC transporter ATP-binding protein [Coriobacteriales bacterium]
MTDTQLDTSTKDTASPKESGVVLETRGLVKRFGTNTVLDGIDLTVHRGEAVVVVGPSGCGKSTLLRCIVGLEQLDGGQVLLDGEVVSGEGASVRSKETRQRVGMVFQSYDLFPNKTVLGNVMLAPLKVQKRDKTKVMAQAEQLLRRIGLWDKRDVYPSTLSGGQKQRIAIVRALMMNPDVMLFDEITAALDPEMVHEVLQVVVELADGGLTMVVVTHEMRFAEALADRIILLDAGHVVEESSNPSQFFSNPQTQRAKDFLRSFEFERSRENE